MATLVSGQIYRTVAACYLLDQVGLNVRYWRCIAFTGVAGTEQSAANGFTQELSLAYRNLIPTVAQYLGVAIQSVATTPPSPIVPPTLGPSAGNAAAVPYPLQVSGMITLRSDNGGRSGRGRIYVPFPNVEAEDETNNTPNNAYVDLLNVLGALYSTDRVITTGMGTTATFRPVLYRVSTATTTNVTTFTSRKRWATQRRRGNYGRTNIPPW